MYKFLFFLSFLFFISVLQAQKNTQICCKSELADFSKATLQELGTEYQRLKALQPSCCQNFHSDLQLLMEDMGKKWELQHLCVKKVIKFAGKADAESVPNQHQQPYICEKGEKLLIYHWRSWHDYMYVVVKGKRVKAVSWYYAYE